MSGRQGAEKKYTGHNSFKSLPHNKFHHSESVYRSMSKLLPKDHIQKEIEKE